MKKSPLKLRVAIKFMISLRGHVFIGNLKDYFSRDETGLEIKNLHYQFEQNTTLKIYCMKNKKEKGYHLCYVQWKNL